MVRSRVLSFISAFGGPSRKDRPEQRHRASSASVALNKPPSRVDTPSTDTPSPQDTSPTGQSSTNERRISRPGSTLFSHDPPFIEISQDTPPELQPIFSFLNSHANKLYHEGYFLKLNDLDNHGRPCPDRQWIECYAQLVGTALSLWDAAALDAAVGEEVSPTFINLADASIKVIETLPTRNPGTPTVKNVLSICSAGQNRYLLHFNSFHSLIQWTSAIRLSLFEHTSLYEAYTGAMIAGKGKSINNIRTILERNRFKHEDWARVRFGAGTPWRRCWFVITPPNEKELQKAQKSLKKKSAYDRAPRLVTGDIKFYETKKTKKAKPIATITDAYSAYAIYPQSKELIEQSTLVKIEGNVTIHSQPQSASEGFVFIMPETHPAVSGFETMIRFLVPSFDTFNLYGRPTRLIAATNHIKSIMFAFPKQRRYGYLDILDIANLMQTPGSQNWSEAEWRKQLKEATARRMAAAGSRTSSISSKPRFRASLPSRHSNMHAGLRRNETFPESEPVYNQSTDAIVQEEPNDANFSPTYHTRGASDTAGFLTIKKPTRASLVESSPSSSARDLVQAGNERPSTNEFNDQSSSDSDWRQRSDPQPIPEAEAIGEHFRSPSPPSPVTNPPAFAHGPGEMPPARPHPSPDLRKANNRMSNATLAQLAAASGNANLLGAMSFEGQEVKETDSQNPRTLTPNGSYNTGFEIPSVPSLLSDSSDKKPSPQEQGPPTPEHRTGIFGPPLGKPNNLHVDTARSVRRKPLPGQQNKDSAVSSPVEPSFDDLRHTVDEEALNRVSSYQPSFTSPNKERQLEDESVYDDESTTSPDYASTHGSVYSKNSTKSIPRPRMGVMKTVGTEPRKDLVIGDAHYTMDEPSQKPNSDIPTVDFGPTMTLMPTTARPTTSDTLRKISGHHRTDSDSTEKQRHPQQMDRGHSRSPSQDEFRRSVLWQPGMAAARPVTPGLTPEQFVQQRAAAAPSPPLHAHHRTPSTTPTPPPARPVSGDWMAHNRSHSQMSIGRDSQTRPRSRGANSIINYNELSSHLSAREQEHVARMTGSSFFNLSSGNQKQQQPVNPMGLVGAIDAREREKKSIIEGMSNHMVQHAIAQRQQQWQQHPMPPSTPSNSYGLQGGAHNSVYNMPAASHTWDALNQPYRPEEPRRQSWYGQLQTQQPQTPQAYPQNQYFSQHPGHVTNANTTHY
ncbi:hypothetical protein BDV29DRAFT_118859 [Aspergillus leporis]|uniref:PH domain-containing protein n=1 Tax=Aspergillus leporis TaxID=41062 RepID=A0A5N5X5R3_9EURO|nr:hypothetical protein BDV29DRAFT_118859 [Aspergillus leporis]